MGWVSDAEFQTFFAGLASAYGAYCTPALRAGTSVGGLPLSVYCLGSSCQPSSSSDEGAAPGLLLTSLLHGREPLGPW